MIPFRAKPKRLRWASAVVAAAVLLGIAMDLAELADCDLCR
ncbi:MULTISPECIES: hypothetical protein [unclassified Bradyrhizobium]|nr:MULTISPECIES: hypothetical protein [unclassified Bradyrhizobium]